jgi:uncharacterized protein (DUF58 family)
VLLVVVLVVGTRLWVRALRRGVSARVELPDRLLHGEPVDVQVVVANRSRLPAPHVRVEVALPGRGFTPSTAVVEVALPGRRARTVSTRSRRSPGAAGVRPRHVRVGDPWGLWEAETVGPEPSEVVVLPAILPVRRVELPAVAPLAELPDRRALTTDPTAIVGVRPYRPGDPLRSIHWGATASTGTLVRREDERAWARDLVVALDLDRRGWAAGRSTRPTSG